MSRRLQLQVILNAVDRATRPLRSIQQGSGRTAEALRASRDQLRQLENAQKNLGGFANLKRTSDNTARSLQQQQQRVRELTQQIRQTEGPTRQLNRQRDAAIRQAQRLKTRYQEEQQQLQTLRGRIQETGGTTRDLGGQQRQLAERIRTANEQMRTQQQRLDQVAQRQRRAAEASQQYQRSMGNVGRLAGVGAGMMGAGVAKGYAAARFLSSGVTFDSTMARVQSLARLESDDAELAAIRNQARELGRSTMFTSSEVGDGQAFLAMAGFDPESIRAAMPGLLDMARAGDMDLGTTADIGSNILTAMKLPAEEMTRVADTLTAAFTRSNTSISTLGETMKYAAPGASQFGVDLDTTAAMAAKLGDAGIQGSMGGTSIRRMLSRLASPTAAASAALEKLGVDTADAEGNLRDIPTVLKEIYDASRDMGDIERGTLWRDIAGETGSSAMGILVDQAGSGELQELIRELIESHGEAARVAAVQSDNWGGDWNQLKSAWQDVGIEAFEQLNDWLRQTTQRITDVIRAAGEWMRENPGLTKTIAKLAGALIIITTVGGALTMMLASVLGPVVMLRYGLQLMAIHGGFLAKTALPAVVGALKALGAAVLAHPIIAIIAAIAAGAIYIWRNWETFGPKFAALWEGIKNIASDAWQGIKNMAGSAWNGITSVLGNAWQGITSMAASVWEGISGVIGSAWEGLTAVAGGAWQGIREAFSEGIAGVSRLLLDWSPLGLLWRGISTALGAMGIELPSTLSELGGAIIGGLIGGLTGGLDHLRETITSMGSNIVGWFKGVLGINSPSIIFQGFGGNLLEGLINGIDDKWGVLRDSISATANGVIGWFKDRLGIQSPSRVFAELGGHTMDGYQQGLERAERGPLGEISAFTNRLRQAGAGLLLGGAALGVSADASTTGSGGGIEFDTRPPLTTATAPAVTVQGDSIVLNVYPSAGMDEQALARHIGRILEERDRQKLARARSAFHDID